MYCVFQNLLFPVFLEDEKKKKKKVVIDEQCQTELEKTLEGENKFIYSLSLSWVKQFIYS